MNKLFTKIVGAALGATMAIGVGVAVARNEAKGIAPARADEVAYTLDGTITGGTNSYTSDSDITQNSVSWKVTANTQQNPWRFGNGKSGSAGTRKVQSQNVVTTRNVSKIVITTANVGITPSAVTLKVGTTIGGSTITNTSFSFSTPTLTINRPDNTDWTGRYFDIGFTVGSTKSKYFQLESIVFYYAGSVSVTGVELNKESTTLTAGATETLTATVKPADATNKNVTWKSYSDSTCTVESNTVASVSNTGVVTANSAGTAYIQVKTEDGGKTDTCQVTVTAPKTPASVSSSGQTTIFDTNDTFTYGGTLTVTYTDSTGKTVSPESFKIGASGINPISAGTVITPGTTVLNRNDHHGKTVYVLYTENNTTVYTSYVITVNAISSVTFVGGTDKGDVQNSITKSGITISVPTDSDGTFIRDDNFRVYAGKDVTIASTVGNIAKIEFTFTTAGYNTLSGTGYTASDENGTWMGDASSVTLSASSQARITLIVVTLASTDPLVELTVDSATSVSMMKGDNNTSVKVHVANITTKTWTFTFDEGGSTGLSTSAYINVSAGAAVSDVHTLTITTKAVGSTTMHIAVSGTACETAVPVAVNAKPASMTIVHSDIHEGELEIITGTPKQVSFSGLDTDGNPYSIAAADVTPSATSGASHVTLSGSRITGASAGDAVVRYTLNALTSVYAEITVHVVDDYIETVGEPTFATGLTDTQGQSPTVSVFTARPGTMHSGESTTVPFENYKFSYDQTYASAEYGSLFTYDFAHGTTVDATHILQTIYVFCDIDEAAHGSYTVTVEKFDDPLREIHLTNVTDHKATITRGDSLQLEWSYTPENPTDGKEVLFTVSENTENISITVNSTGLISVTASSNLGKAKVTIESAHDASINDYVVVTASLESMTYKVDEKETLTPTTTVSVGDNVYMVGYCGKLEKNYELTSINSSSSTHYGVAEEYGESIAKLFLLRIVEGSEDNSFAFKTSDNQYLTPQSGKNGLEKTATLNSASSWAFSESRIQNQGDTTKFIYLNWNSGTPRFACYVDKTSTTDKDNFNIPTFMKVSGGIKDKNVTEALFTAVHSNFGYKDTTYTWSESCPSFDFSSWTTAGSAVKGISGFASYQLNIAIGNINGNEIEQFIAKYDNVVAKFYKDCKTDQEKANLDFLGRVSSGKVVPDESRVSLIGISTNNGLAITIIIISSMISVAAIGGYFFIRRRKHN